MNNEGGQAGTNYRKHERVPTNVVAKLTTGTGACPCIVEDVSWGGAKLALQKVPSVGEQACLTMYGHGDFGVLVAWSRMASTGIEFFETPETLKPILSEADAQVTK